MTQDKKHSLKEVQLPDGTTAYVLDKEHLEALASLLDDRIWMQGFWKRMRRITWIAGTVGGGLVVLSAWWPWIARFIQWLIQDVPKA